MKVCFACNSLSGRSAAEHRKSPLALMLLTLIMNALLNQASAGADIEQASRALLWQEGLEVPGQELKGEGGVPAKEVSEKMNKAGEGEEWDH